MNITVNGYNSEDGFRTAVVAHGPKRLHLVVIESTGVREISMPLTEGRHLVPLYLKGAEYPLARAVRQMRAAARTFGCSRAAKHILDSALAQTKS